MHGLGLDVLCRTPPDGDGGDHDLLALYLGAPADDELLERLTAAGGRRVTARNPYREQWGVTIADLDGDRLVLSHRTWT